MLPGRMFFDDMFDLSTSDDARMKCDIYEEGNQVFIEMDAPGYQKSDIKVECNKGNITIKLEKEEKKEEKKKYLHKERRFYGKIERTFHIEDIDEDSIKAQFKDGILVITINKIDENKNKKLITID